MPKTELTFNNMETLLIEKPEPGVGIIKLNRPNKGNAMSFKMFREIKQAVELLDNDSDVLVIIIEGQGKHFCTGLDLIDAAQLAMPDEEEPARYAIKMLKVIKDLQDCISSVEVCKKPVIAIVQGYCIGAGVDLITACDVRYVVQDAQISVREVAIGMAADVGTLQRLPKVVGNSSWVRELIYTGKFVTGEECFRFNLFSKIFENYESCYKGALELAREINSKSPVALVGCKTTLNYSRDHTVDEGLSFIAHWNMWALQCKDIMTAVSAQMSKSKAVFPKL